MAGRISAHDGLVAYQSQRYEDAVRAYSAATTRLPEVTLVRRNLALSHLAASRTAAGHEAVQTHLDAAVTLLREAVERTTELTPAEHRELRELLVNTWLESGKLGDASAYFLRETQTQPNDEAFRMLGLVEAQRGNYRAAIAAYTERTRLRPEDAGVHAALATLTWEWLRAGGPEDNAHAVAAATHGVEAAARARELDSNHPSALVYAGLLLRERAKRQSDPALAQEDVAHAERLHAQFRSPPSSP